MKILNTLYVLASRILSAVVNGFSTLTQKLLGVKNEIDGIKDEQASQRLILAQILAAVTPAPTASVVITFTVGGQTFEGVSKLQLTDTQQATFTLAPEDAKKNASSIDPTKTTLTSDTPGVATVTMNPDGLSGTVIAGSIGSAQLTGSVTDANDPADVVPIGPVTITVVAGDTASVGVNFGTPTAQAPAGS